MELYVNTRDVLGHHQLHCAFVSQLFKTNSIASELDIKFSNILYAKTVTFFAKCEEFVQCKNYYCN